MTSKPTDIIEEGWQWLFEGNWKWAVPLGVAFWVAVFWMGL